LKDDDVYNLSVTGEEISHLLAGIQRMKDYGEAYKRLFKKLDI